MLLLILLLQVAADTAGTFHLSIPSPLVQEVLVLCTSHLESPHRGVPEACSATYTLLLGVVEAAWQEEERTLLLTTLLTSALALPWSQKSKYPLLAILLIPLGAKHLLQSCPGLPQYLATSLASTHLVHAGLDLYRLLASSLPPASWQASCGLALLSSLLSSSSTVAQRSRSHWLPATYNLQPTALPWLKQQLEQEDGEAALLARLALLGLARAQGEQEEEGGELPLLQRCAAHPNPEIRAAVFNAICQAKKRGSVPPATELELVLGLLQNSATVHCSRCCS